MSTSVTLSFEFFPPKSEAMEARLWQSIETLAVLDPAFVSVTYGAGGTTRDRTHRTVARIAADTPLKAAAHLTCVGASREEVNEVIDQYGAAGVRHIVALRGDPPEGVDAPYIPYPDGYANAAALTEAIKARGDFEVSVGCYPEVHPQSASPESDLDNLKAKVVAGADRAITQFFFEPDTYFRFLDRAEAHGIDLPIVPGIMLQSNFAGLEKMSKLCGTHLPDRIRRAYHGIAPDSEAAMAITAQLVGQLCERLYAGGVRHFHFYTLNKPDLALATCRLLDFGPTRKVA